jgi:hypothetical protein
MAPAQQASVDASLQDIYLVVLREMKPGSLAPPVPILIQDFNGPCGLIALVNAMMITGKNPALEAALRRSQSLPLQQLLEALVETTFEYVVGLDPTLEPDSLYVFFRSLHDGMTVNARFVGESFFAPSLDVTRYEMFGFELVHGWVPEVDARTRRVFAEHAPTWDDAQTARIRLKELEERLDGSQSLETAELQLVEELGLVESFLQSSPSQLTAAGRRALADRYPGDKVVILFRNNHFAPVYRRGQDGRLYQLVTDAGVVEANPAIVWEGLVVGSESPVWYTAGFVPTTFGAAGQVGVDARLWRGDNDDSNSDSCSTTGVLGAAPSSSRRPEQVESDEALARALQEELNRSPTPRASARLEQQSLAAQGRRSSNPVSSAPLGMSGRGSFPSGRRSTDARGGGVQSPQTRSRNRETWTAPRPATQALSPALPLVVRPAPAVTAAATTPHTSFSQPPGAGRSTRAPLTHRPNGEEPDDAAPPRYEDAVHLPVFFPPVGHPAHPTSTPTLDDRERVPQCLGQGAPRPLQQQQQQQRQLPVPRPNGRPAAAAPNAPNSPLNGYFRQQQQLQQLRAQQLRRQMGERQGSARMTAEEEVQLERCHVM